MAVSIGDLDNLDSADAAVLKAAVRRGDEFTAILADVRRERLRRARAMTVRQRLEALDELTRLSERIQAMRRTTGQAPGKNDGANNNA